MGNFWASIITWAFPPQPVAGEIYREEKPLTSVDKYIKQCVCQEKNDE
jgi:hypothetical protein